MRYLVVSDLHSNFEALGAVLADARGQYDRIVCCGDLVGYGPDPNRVVDWARANVATSIRGNHDRVCCGIEDPEWFSPSAQEAARWTMTQLTPESLNWLRELPRGPVEAGGFAIAHGSPLDEDEYVASLAEAANVFDYLDLRVTFFGHTHLQGGFVRGGDRRTLLAKPHRREAETNLRLAPDSVYLINPGSVGQPRDGDPRAAYALYESDTRDLLLRRVAYDFESVERKIAVAGLPRALGHRLAFGR